MLRCSEWGSAVRSQLQLRLGAEGQRACLPIAGNDYPNLEINKYTALRIGHKNPGAATAWGNLIPGRALRVHQLVRVSRRGLAPSHKRWVGWSLQSESLSWRLGSWPKRKLPLSTRGRHLAHDAKLLIPRHQIHFPRSIVTCHLPSYVHHKFTRVPPLSPACLFGGVDLSWPAQQETREMRITFAS